MESPWGFHEQKFGILNSNRIPNSELLPLESPWQFHEQKFGILNSIALFDLFAQKSQKGIWNSEFQTSAHGIAMAIPSAEFQNSEFYWNSKLRTSAHGIPMAIPWAEVWNRHRHGQKFLSPKSESSNFFYKLKLMPSQTYKEWKAKGWHFQFTVYQSKV